QGAHPGILDRLAGQQCQDLRQPEIAAQHAITERLHKGAIIGIRYQGEGRFQPCREGLAALDDIDEEIGGESPGVQGHGPSRRSERGFALRKSRALMRLPPGSWISSSCRLPWPVATSSRSATIA